MFGRNWGFFAASFTALGGVLAIFFLVAIVGLNYCPGEPCNYERGENGGRTDHEYWIPFGAGPDTTSHSGPSDAVGSEKYYERQDLRAQESAARAAISMAKIGLFTFVLSIIGSIFLGWNLVQTRQGNEINRDAAFAQTRAWLSCDVSLANQRMVPGERGIRWTARAQCQNHGSSPALEVKFFVEMALGPLGRSLEERMVEFAESKNGSKGYGEVLFPASDEIHEQELMLMYDDIDKAVLSDKEFKAIFPVVYGCLNYRIPGSEIVHQTIFGYHVCNIINGKPFLPMPTRHDWLEIPMVIVRPGVVKAT